MNVSKSISTYYANLSAARTTGKEHGTRPGIRPITVKPVTPTLTSETTPVTVNSAAVAPSLTPLIATSTPISVDTDPTKPGLIAPHGPVETDPVLTSNTPASAPVIAITPVDISKIDPIAPHGPVTPIDIGGDDGGDDTPTLYDPAINGPANQFKAAAASYDAAASTNLVTGHAIPTNLLDA